MSDNSGTTKKLSLSNGKLTLSSIDPSKLRAGPAVGAGRKTVQVEVRRKRAPAAPSRTQTPPRLNHLRRPLRNAGGHASRRAIFRRPLNSARTRRPGAGAARRA